MDLGDLRLTVDVKPLLGAAQIKVVNLGHNQTRIPLTIEVEQQTFFLKDGPNVIAEAKYNGPSFQRVEFPLDDNLEGHGRAQIKGQRFGMMPRQWQESLNPGGAADPRTLKKIMESLQEKRPMDVKARCKKCKGGLGNFSVKRVLPLPSINWQQDSHNWFCACVPHGHVGCGDSKTTSKGLATKDLKPNVADVLYCSSFLLCHQSNFNGVSNHDNVAICSICKGQLGLYIFNQDIIQFWSIAVTFDEEDEDQPSDIDIQTFLAVIDEILKDYKYLSANLTLVNANDLQDRLQIKVISGETKVYTAPLSRSGSELELTDFYPVIYKHLDHQNQVDQSEGTQFTLTPEAFGQGVKWMKEISSRLLPKNCQVDPLTHWSLGYLRPSFQ